MITIEERSFLNDVRKILTDLKLEENNNSELYLNLKDRKISLVNDQYSVYLNKYTSIDNCISKMGDAYYYLTIQENDIKAIDYIELMLEYPIALIQDPFEPLFEKDPNNILKNNTELTYSDILDNKYFKKYTDYLLNKSELNLYDYLILFSFNKSNEDDKDFISLLKTFEENYNEYRDDILLLNEDFYDYFLKSNSLFLKMLKPMISNELFNNELTTE